MHICITCSLAELHKRKICLKKKGFKNFSCTKKELQKLHRGRWATTRNKEIGHILKQIREKKAPDINAHTHNLTKPFSHK